MRLTCQAYTADKPNAKGRVLCQAPLGTPMDYPRCWIPLVLIIVHGGACLDQRQEEIDIWCKI